jgi:hypothetical protein
MVFIQRLLKGAILAGCQCLAPVQGRPDFRAMVHDRFTYLYDDRGLNGTGTAPMSAVRKKCTLRAARYPMNAS